MEYISIYSGEEIERILGSVKNKADKELVNDSVSSLEDKIQNKQDTITDLNSIREGSKKGNTSLQPDQVKTINGNSIIGTGNIVIESEKIDLSEYATKDELVHKLDKIEDLESIRIGATKGSTALLEELYKGTYSKPITGIPKNDLSYDVQQLLDKANNSLQQIPPEYITELELINKDYATTSILNYVVSTKLDIIHDLNLIRSNSEKGATAIQPNDIKTINGLSIVGEGDILIQNENIDLSNYATKNDLDNKMDKVTLAAVATSGSYNDLSNKPTIPSAVTESTVSGWGFTKNTGTYTKPFTGIPKSDLASTIQTSLGKADTALQSHQDISGKQDTLVSGTNIKTINGNSILGSGDIEVRIETDNFTQKLVFENVTANLWYSDSWYTDYPYVCNITIDGILSTDYAEVIFDPEHAASGNYAPVCETTDRGIYIFSKTTDPIQIPTIIIFR